MSDFEPGEGWREVQAADVGPGQRYLITIDADLVNRPDVRRYWVREVPVPPLPTAPGYYLAEQPTYGDTVVVELLGSPKGQWVDAGDRNYLQPDDVRVLGPLVRLEPRAETAKAVLARVQQALPIGWDSYSQSNLAEIARDFEAAGA